MMRAIGLILGLGVLAACEAALPVPEPQTEPRFGMVGRLGGLPAPEVAARNFIQVVDIVEPVAERICRAEAPAELCDFEIVVDRRTDQPANAYQTVDPNGRPIIAFTVALIAEAENKHELAFILGHEAAHHIAGHIPRTQQTALGGALLAGVVAAVTGADAQTIGAARDVGAAVGARAYSKEYELEADALGTVIAFRAGFDPAIGAQYFNRIQDPGNRFLGSHPPNAARIAIVEETLKSLK